MLAHYKCVQRSNTYKKCIKQCTNLVHWSLVTGHWCTGDTGQIIRNQARNGYMEHEKCTRLKFPEQSFTVRVIAKWKSLTQELKEPKQIPVLGNSSNVG